MPTPRSARRTAFAALAPSALLAVAGCGSAALPTIPTGRPNALKPTARLPVRHDLGSTVTVALSETTLHVTVERVIDPLTDSGAHAPPGDHIVGVLLAVDNLGPATYDSSATSDFALRTHDGAAMPVYAPAGQCQTYVQDFLNQVGPGQARTGCIAYAVSSGDPLRTVRFTPYGTLGTRRVSWQVPAR